MSGKYLSQADFLTGILGTPEDFDVPGLGLVQLRALTVAEVSQINKDAGDDNMAQMTGAIAHGLLAPKLDEAAISQMRTSGAAGYVMKIATRIMELSGMIEGDKLGEAPGGGSSTVPATALLT